MIPEARAVRRGGKLETSRTPHKVLEYLSQTVNICTRRRYSFATVI